MIPVLNCLCCNASSLELFHLPRPEQILCSSVIERMERTQPSVHAFLWLCCHIDPRREGYVVRANPAKNSGLHKPKSEEMGNRVL